MNAPFEFQQLVSPNGSSFSLSQIISSTEFGDKIFVVAEFSDGSQFAYYDGNVVSDFISGIVNGTQFNTNSNIAAGLSALAQGTGLYTSTTGAGGAGTFDILSIPTTSSANAFTASITLSLQTGSTGAISQTNISTGSAASGPGIATGTLTIVAGGDNIHATGTLTSDGTNVSSGDTVVIGSVTYTYKTTPAANYDVQVDASSADTSLQNLINCVNGTGTGYHSGTPKNTQVTGGTLTSHATVFTAINAGTPGNSIAASTTAAHLTWSGLSGGDLSGGTNVNYVNAVKIGASNLFSGGTVVPYNQNANQTATDVASAIATNSSSSGFTASATNNVVTISTTSGTDSYNGDDVETDCVGNVCCEDCILSLTGTGFVLNGIYIDPTDTNVNIMSSTETFSSGTLADFVQTVVSNINANTSTSGYLAYAPSGYTALYISKANVLSTDPVLGIQASLTPSSGQTGGAYFGTPSSNPLVLTLSTSSGSSSQVVCIINDGGSSRPPGPIYLITVPITATPSGGIAPYTYAWTFPNNTTFYFAAYDPASVINRGGAPWDYTTINPTLPTVVFQSKGYYYGREGNANAVCTVTDSSGASISQTISIIIPATP